jgi:hypothetical protein
MNQWNQVRWFPAVVCVLGDNCGEGDIIQTRAACGFQCAVEDVRFHRNSGACGSANGFTCRDGAANQTSLQFELAFTPDNPCARCCTDAFVGLHRRIFSHPERRRTNPLTRDTITFVVPVPAAGWTNENGAERPRKIVAICDSVAGNPISSEFKGHSTAENPTTWSQINWRMGSVGGRSRSLSMGSSSRMRTEFRGFNLTSHSKS